jgi:TonB family protein
MFPLSNLLRPPLVLLLVLSVCLTEAGPAFSQTAPSRVKAKRNSKPTDVLPETPSVVADASVWQLPPKYLGDNAGSVYQRLAALGPRLRKSQFETTPEFQARIRLLLEGIKIGPNRTANDRLSFVHPYGDETYDADTQVFTLKPDTNFEAAVGYDVPEVQGDVRSIRGYKSIDLTRTGRTVSSRIGRTALGVRKRITVRAYSSLRLVMSDASIESWSYGLKFRITPSMARQASGRVWLVVTGRLAYPYVIYESDVDNATLDDPEEAHSFHYYLFFVPESVVLYNIATGQIYGSWDLTQSGSTADRIATPIVPPTSETRNESTNKSLATKPRILSKPEPQYTEEARQNQITGTVVLSVVFAETGEVTDIQVIQGLSHGLSERAIEAAKKIRFVPAESNGKKVPFKILLEYNFNLY